MSEVALCRHSAQLFGCKPIKIQFSPSMSHSIPFLTDYVDRNIFLVKLLLESNYSKLSHGSVPKLLVGANNFHLQHMEKKKDLGPNYSQLQLFTQVSSSCSQKLNDFFLMSDHE